MFTIIQKKLKMINQNEEMVEQALIEPNFPSVVENSKVAMQKDSSYP